MFKTGALTRIKLNTKDLLATTDLYSSNTEGPSVLEQDPVVLGMPKHGTKPQFLLPGAAGSPFQPCTEITITHLSTGIAHIMSTFPSTELP